jgi:uncharacterized membrane protein YgdD (TMEM256/DUF423 family)
MKWKYYTQFSLLICAIGILTGAFGAHALKDKLPSNDLNIFDTAVKYSLFLGLSILTLSINHRHFNYRLSTALLFMSIGICLFAGSLFMISLNSFWPGVYLKGIGVITPIGGIAMIFGFIYTSFFCLSKIEESKSSSSSSSSSSKKSHRKTTE